MENKKRAKVYWVQEEQGGKKGLTQLTCSTAAHFIDDTEGQDWSVNLEIIYKIEENIHLCYISFLSNY